MKRILLTGCAGFIGSNFVKTICLDEEVRKEYSFYIIDSLTYAGHYPTIQKDVENNSHIKFEKLDIGDHQKISDLFKREKFDGVINFAAESHVDRSIVGPNVFVETNVLGTLNLLNHSKDQFEKNGSFRFLQISTDEVYGSLKKDDPPFNESTPLAPNSPYSASKASADMLVRSFHHTYGLPTLVSRCSNNYGPYQFPEKLIPLMINNANKEIELPVYGKGENIRDWIHVDDHNRGIWRIFRKGRAGEVYNLGGNSEMVNLDIVTMILKHLGKSKELISFVTDRLGHDFRYAMDFSKAERELGWKPQIGFEDGLKSTIDWYMDNQEWVKSVK